MGTKWLVTVQGFNDNASFLGKKNGDIETILVNEHPYTWYSNSSWKEVLPGFTRIVILYAVQQP